MDHKSLASRVADLGASTTALIKKRVVDITEAKPRKRGATAKASTSVIGAADGPVANSNALPTADETNTIFTNAGAIFPPYEPETLVMLFEHSNSLRPCVDSYVTNIESFGYRFEPTIDLEAPEADTKLGDAIFLERLHQSQRESGDLAQAAYPTPEEIEVRKKEITALMRIERARLEVFIDDSVPESSMVDLREKTRVDYEVTGNAYWEVLRNGADAISQFSYIPAHSVRLLPISSQLIDVQTTHRVSACTVEKRSARRRFRAFAQVVLNQVVYFKEFGDPRALNSRTGRYYDSLDELRRDDPQAVPATELVHFRVHSARSPYGVPRWIGNLLSVLGSRASEEVNYLYFDNKAIPPIAVLVSGGRLAEGSKAKIESYIKDHIRGKENFHKILIIEAIGQGTPQTPGLPDAGRTRITIEKLTDQQQKDGLFQTYDERNIDKVGSSFRLPRLLRGDVRDFNKATAESALEFAEMQVFQPERNKFDNFMNRQVLPEMGVRFWAFTSNTPVSKDPEALTEMVTKLTMGNVITPEEAREVARDIFNREFKKIDADWTKLPVALTLAGYALAPAADDSAATEAAGALPADTSQPSATPAPVNDRNLAAVAANLSQLRDKLNGAAKVAAERTAQVERKAFDDEQVIKIELTKAQIDELIENDAAE